ncbi:Retrovirus-related Pol polyprotein from transposon TNT 1-94 [Senna tora]|uniref:Retrovirus-related Pol polyprotein from transposon TNT 1-94 n=1 Tax=Senna tora TaxID=362788 RepID=A0A834T0R4_9FABA|nr:Retrovirus-related Pol polyprotein from transposon TNT 1-94 [Senna tora]
MLGSSVNSNSMEESALVAHGVSHNLGNGQKKGRAWCDHCHRPGHVKDKCWKLHGKPDSWKCSKEKTTSGLNSSSSSDSSSSTIFNKDKVALPQRILSEGSSNIVATGSSAEKGNFSNALHVTSNPSNYWIVDSGASNHMSEDSGVFSSWYPFTKNYKVRIADGSLSDVIGIGEVYLTVPITLKSVLFLPTLKCNLLSIDVDSGKVIGNARVHDGLYRDEMNRESTSNKQSFAAGLEKGSSKEDRDIMVLHFRPTNEFPHPLVRVPQSAGYWLSYVIVDLLIWWGIRGIINDFRKRKLKLAPIAYFSMYRGSLSHLPTGYMWSPHVVPKPSAKYEKSLFVYFRVGLYHQCFGESSIRMDDLLGSPCVAPLL